MLWLSYSRGKMNPVRKVAAKDQGTIPLKKGIPGAQSNATDSTTGEVELTTDFQMNSSTYIDPHAKKLSFINAK